MFFEIIRNKKKLNIYSLQDKKCISIKKNFIYKYFIINLLRVCDIRKKLFIHLLNFFVASHIYLSIPIFIIFHAYFILF